MGGNANPSLAILGDTLPLSCCFGKSGSSLLLCLHKIFLLLYAAVTHQNPVSALTALLVPADRKTYGLTAEVTFSFL